MSALQQYIDLFNANRDAFGKHSCGPLNALRYAALEALSGAHLPKRGEENYETTDLESVFATDYGVNINRINLSANPNQEFRCDVSGMRSWLYYFINDVFQESSLNAQSEPLPDGVVVASLCEVAHTHPNLVEKYYGKLAPLSDSKVAINTLLAQDGLFIYIPKNVALSRPIQLVNMLNAAAPIMAVRRIVVVLEENAQAKLLVCDHAQNFDIDFLSSQVIEVFAADNAVFDYYDIEEGSPLTHRVNSVFVEQSSGSNVLINGITLNNGFTRNEIKIDVNGENAETQLYGMAVGSADNHIDNHTYINHNAGHCHSNELFKYVLDDKATGAFSGIIYVSPNCPKIEAYQSNKNICATPCAKMHSKPQLIIHTDDVKCSHGSSVGQLDENALLYMRCRGIDLKEARTMLMQAFMSDVVESVRLDTLKDRLHRLVEKRFNGTVDSCASCTSKCLKPKN